MGENGREYWPFQVLFPDRPELSTSDLFDLDEGIVRYEKTEPAPEQPEEADDDRPVLAASRQGWPLRSASLGSARASRQRATGHRRRHFPVAGSVSGRGNSVSTSTSRNDPAAVVGARSRRRAAGATARASRETTSRGARAALGDAGPRDGASWWSRWPLANIGLRCDGLTRVRRRRGSRRRLAPRPRASLRSPAGDAGRPDRQGEAPVLRLDGPDRQLDGGARPPAGDRPPRRGRGYVVAPPSVHASGRRYSGRRATTGTCRALAGTARPRRVVTTWLPRSFTSSNALNEKRPTAAPRSTPSSSACFALVRASETKGCTWPSSGSPSSSPASSCRGTGSSVTARGRPAARARPRGESADDPLGRCRPGSDFRAPLARARVRARCRVVSKDMKPRDLSPECVVTAVAGGFPGIPDFPDFPLAGNNRKNRKKDLARERERKSARAVRQVERERENGNSARPSRLARHRCGRWVHRGNGYQCEHCGPLRIRTRTCTACGEETSSASRYFCAGCHFAGWWGRWE